MGRLSEIRYTINSIECMEDGIHAADDACGYAADLEARVAELVDVNRQQDAAIQGLQKRVMELEAERSTSAIAPNPFRLNPPDGTLGYILILAAYDGNLDEWIMHDNAMHQGWRTASMIEPPDERKEGE